MILTTLLDVGFQLAPRSDGQEGVTMNFMDKPSNQVVSVPLPPDAMLAIAGALIDVMPPEIRKTLVPKVAGGIVLPNDMHNGGQG